MPSTRRRVAGPGTPHSGLRRAHTLPLHPQALALHQALAGCLEGGGCPAWVQGSHWQLADLYPRAPTVPSDGTQPSTAHSFLGALPELCPQHAQEHLRFSGPVSTKGWVNGESLVLWEKRPRTCREGARAVPNRMSPPQPDHALPLACPRCPCDLLTPASGVAASIVAWNEQRAGRRDERPTVFLQLKSELAPSHGFIPTAQRKALDGQSWQPAPAPRQHEQGLRRASSVGLGGAEQHFRATASASRVHRPGQSPQLGAADCCRALEKQPVGQAGSPPAEVGGLDSPS